MPGVQPIPSNNLWFDDGSIVLIAATNQSQDDSELRSFRVHRSVLTAQSDVFSDMLSIPQPSKPERMEDCPVVRMPDSAEDLTHLLKSLYDPGYLPGYDGLVNLSAHWDLVDAVLRLSTKFNIRILRHRTLTILNTYWPSNFSDYQALSKDTRATSLKFSVRAIKLARDANVPHILPVAFYLIARQPLAQIFAVPEQNNLTYPDLAKCILGRDSLRLATRCTVYPQFFPSGLDRLWNQDACTHHSRGECALRFFAPISKAESFDAVGGPGCLDSRFSWPASQGTKSTSPCLSCLKAMQRVEEDGRQGVWRSLPSYFKLGTWEELRSLGRDA